ncbi:MAG: signal peptidase I [Oscillospiraceae bacterium]|nr:signal peptidase I [Oscillospiraceae bacterium]
MAELMTWEELMGGGPPAGPGGPAGDAPQQEPGGSNLFDFAQFAAQAAQAERPAGQPAPSPFPSPDSPVDPLEALFAGAFGIQGPAGKKNVKAPKEAKPGKPDTAAKKMLRAAYDVTFWLVCVALVAGSVLFVLSKDQKKSYFGYRLYSVISDSMTPAKDGSSPPGGFRRGDMIIVRLCEDPGEIGVGDIITFATDNKGSAYLTHRVMGMKDEYRELEGPFFITRGDTNQTDDPPVPFERVIGKKVAAVPKMGITLTLLQARPAVSIIMVVAFFSCLMMFKWYITGAKEEKAKARG